MRHAGVETRGWNGCARRTNGAARLAREPGRCARPRASPRHDGRSAPAAPARSRAPQTQGTLVSPDAGQPCASVCGRPAVVQQCDSTCATLAVSESSCCCTRTGYALRVGWSCCCTAWTGRLVYDCSPRTSATFILVVVSVHVPRGTARGEDYEPSDPGMERGACAHAPRTVVRTPHGPPTAYGPPHQMLGPNAKCYGAAMVAADQTFAVARRKSAAHRRGVARQSRACAERARRVGSCGRKDAAGPRALAPAGTVRRTRASIGEGAGG